VAFGIALGDEALGCAGKGIGAHSVTPVLITLMFVKRQGGQP
jgi:hypothetical protein